MEEILKIENFRLTFYGKGHPVPAVLGVDLTVHEGETVALVGESGCGKTSLCRCILMLQASHAAIESGRIMLLGRDVTNMTEDEMQRVRGRDASIVFQDPMSSLNPVFSIGEQITTPMMLHRGMDRKTALIRAAELMDKLGFENSEALLKMYPHQLSGGMRQRVAIAIAVACDPKLIIADEPTTALDIETQAKIMEVLKHVGNYAGRGMIFVTHDLGLAREIADRIVVMKDGRIIEEGSPAAIFNDPQQDYTRQLIGYAQYGKGGSHVHRGPDEHRHQHDDPAPTHQHSYEGQPGSIVHEHSHGPDQHVHQHSHAASDIALTVRGISKSFDGRTILQDLDLDVHRGEIVGIVGPSGCGKSTLARLAMGIYKPDHGSISFAPGTKARMIFQDSDAALDPRMTIRQIIAEPLVIAERSLRSRILPHKHSPEIDAKVLDVMTQVGLDASLADRHPYDVSGGQRQRAAIARALITDPDFIIADEPISSLDVSIQAQIIHLLRELRDQRDMTMIIIAHDLPMVQHISDRIVTLSR